MTNKYLLLVLLTLLLLTTKQTVSGQSSDTTDSRNIVILAFELQKCDSVSKEKDNVISGFKSTVDYQNGLITDEKSQIDLMNEGSKFTKEQLDSLTKALNDSNKKLRFRTFEVYGISIVGIITTAYGFLHTIK